ncbi:11652_t:CDS:1, partial [Acaulospora colombiana]
GEIIGSPPAALSKVSTYFLQYSSSTGPCEQRLVRYIGSNLSACSSNINQRAGGHVRHLPVLYIELRQSDHLPPDQMHRKTEKGSIPARLSALKMTSTCVLLAVGPLGSALLSGSSSWKKRGETVERSVS